MLGGGGRSRINGTRVRKKREYPSRAELLKINRPSGGTGLGKKSLHTKKEKRNVFKRGYEGKFMAQSNPSNWRWLQGKIGGVL